MKFDAGQRVIITQQDAEPISGTVSSQTGNWVMVGLDIPIENESGHVFTQMIAKDTDCAIAYE